MLGAHLSTASAATDQPNATPNPVSTPSILPTQEPGDVWHVRLTGYPDSVGVGGYDCQGCDRRFESHDRAAATDQALQPLMVVIHEPGRREHIYWRGVLKRSEANRAEVQQVVNLNVPPPYEIKLMTLSPIGYTLCPNSPAIRRLNQDDFDGSTNGRPGTGRTTGESWYFWHCDR
jgi:hypothetical protein